MIIKPSTIPSTNLKLHALIRCLPLNHKMRPQVLEDFNKRNAGYRGEESIDYYLDPLPHKDFHIFHGLRLKNEKYHFQIDTLLASSCFKLIIELKNFTGDIYFDNESKQFFQIFNGQKEGYQNPIVQAERQKLELARWLNKNNIKQTPIEYLVAIKNPSTKIEVSAGGEHILDKVMHFDHLLTNILLLQKKYRKPLLDSNALKTLDNKLLRSHTPKSIDVLDHYNIDKADIITGVQCPKCRATPMKRIIGKWQCQKCFTESKNAHETTIHDYLLLISPTITNKQCREFLHISDRSLASRLLNSMDLLKTGTLKGTEYERIE
ncbi:nuclease-related domain-containing protein [Aquibacillus albus]|uniref:NERD domain-containing protein n=1 Tax=Aquibacillus albus TaxID=1168171 RepID=A0ABS2MZN7_9BACI|nr:nuclease-related domain-containing protein [Aquibacillus albus]MBM7571342.1 hypothetical protein [Aquibacillus albus]